MRKVAIIGAGAFGYAIIKHLDRKNDGSYKLHVFDVDKEIMDYLKKNRSHKYFHKTTKISKKVVIENNYKDLISNSDIIVLAVPSFATRVVLKNMKPYVPKKPIMLNVAKALDVKTGKTLSKIVTKAYPNAIYATLAGGTISYDLLGENPLGIDIACKNKTALKQLVNLFNSKYLHVYPTTDVEGVEYASAFKNVLSIMAGMMNGLGYPVGTETLMISRGSKEVQELVSSKLGGKKETFSTYTQSWGNDLWMSCMGKTRNREFGIEIGKSKNVQKSFEKMKKKKYSIEGINTLNAISTKLLAKNSKYPILNIVAKIILEKKNPQKMLDVLINKNF